MSRSKKIYRLLVLLILNFRFNLFYLDRKYPYGLCFIYNRFLGKGSLQDIIPELYSKATRTGSYWWSTDMKNAWIFRHRAIVGAIWTVIKNEKNDE